MTSERTRPPTRVKVGPYGYRVTLIPPGGDTLGLCHLDSLTIQVQENQPLDIERDTVLHEVLHACLALTGHNLVLGADAEEALIRALSPILLHTLRRNKRLRRYLLS